MVRKSIIEEILGQKPSTPGEYGQVDIKIQQISSAFVLKN